MTNSSKSRLLVIGLMLSVAIGAPVASIVANAPHRAAATADATPDVGRAEEYVMPEDVVRGPATIGEVVVIGSPAKKPASRPEARRSCRRIALEQQGIGYESHVTMCEG
jgi:hypothetical protein